MDKEGRREEGQTRWERPPEVSWPARLTDVIESRKLVIRSERATHLLSSTSTYCERRAHEMDDMDQTSQRDKQEMITHIHSLPLSPVILTQIHRPLLTCWARLCNGGTFSRISLATFAPIGTGGFVSSSLKKIWMDRTGHIISDWQYVFCMCMDTYEPFWRRPENGQTLATMCLHLTQHLSSQSPNKAWRTAGWNPFFQSPSLSQITLPVFYLTYPSARRIQSLLQLHDIVPLPLFALRHFCIYI